MTTQTETLIALARQIAGRDNEFQLIRGPGTGNRATNTYMKALREAACAELGDCAEKCVCGPNRFCVDFYLEREGTIVEIALGLPNPATEFEKDLLKAIMAKDAGNHVDRLVLISRPGAIRKCAQPGRAAMIAWIKRHHSIDVVIEELAGIPRPRRRRRQRASNLRS